LRTSRATRWLLDSMRRALTASIGRPDRTLLLSWSAPDRPAPGFALPA
jgi:hypothetical protein